MKLPEKASQRQPPEAQRRCQVLHPFSQENEGDIQALKRLGGEEPRAIHCSTQHFNGPEGFMHRTLQVSQEPEDR